jgi:hypothetical protein
MLDLREDDHSLGVPKGGWSLPWILYDCETHVVLDLSDCQVQVS